MYITILDYSDGRVHQYSVDVFMQSIECEELIMDYGFNLNNIEWMYHSDKKIY
jgi:hypothetical protein